MITTGAKYIIDGVNTGNKTDVIIGNALLDYQSSDSEAFATSEADKAEASSCVKMNILESMLHCVSERVDQLQMSMARINNRELVYHSINLDLRSNPPVEFSGGLDSDRSYSCDTVYIPAKSRLCMLNFMTNSTTDLTIKYYKNKTALTVGKTGTVHTTVPWSSYTFNSFFVVPDSLTFTGGDQRPYQVDSISCSMLLSENIICRNKQLSYYWDTSVYPWALVYRGDPRLIATLLALTQFNMLQVEIADMAPQANMAYTIVSALGDPTVVDRTWQANTNEAVVKSAINATITHASNVVPTLKAKADEAGFVPAPSVVDSVSDGVVTAGQFLANQATRVGGAIATKVVEEVAETSFMDLFVDAVTTIGGFLLSFIL
jgi:hypothetical protein